MENFGKSEASKLGEDQMMHMIFTEGSALTSSRQEKLSARSKP